MSATEGPTIGGHETVPTLTQRFRNFYRQNSRQVGLVAEAVVLPRSRRSVHRYGRTREQVPLESQQRDSPAEKYQIPKKEFPYFMITISVIQGVVHYHSKEFTWLILCYDPFRRHETWRFFTIMFVHLSLGHLLVNVLFQFAFGNCLEIVHGWRRVSLIYISGVVGGSLAITVLEPKSYGVGASAGVYALLTAHFATILINWDEMDNKLWTVFMSLCYIAIFDVRQIVGYGQDIRTSHSGHFGGSLTGFLVSVLVLRNFEKHPWERKFQKMCAGIILALFLTVVIVNVSVPSYYLKEEFHNDYEQTYLNYTFNYIVQSGEESGVWKRCNKSWKCRELLEQFRYNGTLPYKH